MHWYGIAVYAHIIRLSAQSTISSYSLCTSGALSGTVIVMGARFSRRRGTCARFFRRARRQIQQTRVATTEAILTPANSVTRTETQCETNAAGTGHAQQQVSAPEQTRVASISEACPTPANVTRTETDAAGTGQLQRSKSRTGKCRSARPYKKQRILTV